MGTKLHLLQSHGFWFPPDLTPNSFATFQQHFQAHDTDLIISSIPKTGTTWLKALLFAIVNRHQPSSAALNTSLTNLLSTHNPHELVHYLEMGVYGEGPMATIYPRPIHLDSLPSPRLFQTHVPFLALPKSIIASKCKIVYIARNPFDALVSQWHFYPGYVRNLMGEELFQPQSFENYFEDFYNGTIPFGPFFEHVLGYWNQSLEQPNKVLFLKYEDLKEDPVFHVKRLADFVGFPFSHEEESGGVVQEIIELCSIKNMKEMEVNKSGVINKIVKKRTLFRKGEVGDWANYFTPVMIERMRKLMEDKLGDTGLSFKFLPE